MLLRTLGLGLVLVVMVLLTGCCHKRGGCCAPCCTPCCTPCCNSCCYSPAGLGAPQ